MKIYERGHIYGLEHLDGENEEVLTFVNREDRPHPGTTTQEVIRALIDRTRHCDNCLRWPGNDQIIHHLRMALLLHEIRALERKVEKNEIVVEQIKVSEDGHFRLLHEKPQSQAAEFRLNKTEGEQ